MGKYKGKRAKATDIPQSVKEAVWERDNHRCVLCGSEKANPWCHLIARSQGGLGIEQNVISMCDNCHRRYDNTTDRKSIKAFLIEYIKGFYPDWNEQDVVYDKWSMLKQ